ncbi:MAG: hypothetical protein WA814_05695, partial [Candidatus Baltobacteraceae bacterium]
LSLLCASAALAFGLALSACSSNAGSSSAVPSGGQASAMDRSGHGLSTHLMPGVKPMTIGCDYSVYAFCFYVTPGDPGPYVTTSGASSIQLYNYAWIVKNSSKKGKPDKKFKTYFYPDPGNPTSQYITFKGKGPSQDGPVKFTDYYCIGFGPSDCNGGVYTFKLGIALTPKG